MIVNTNCTVSHSLIKTAIDSFNTSNFKTSLNESTGSFFYDPWVIKPEFRNTPWEQLLNSLNQTVIGEARIIKLDIEKCYTAHADIDDRWHLALGEGLNYLVDLEHKTFYTTQLGLWYSMDAGILHSAVNFSDSARYQLVVRKLLTNADIKNSINIKILVQGVDGRYQFDQTLSPWLNRANKRNCINSFSVNNNIVSFNTTHKELSYIKKIIPENFELTYE